MVSKISVLSIVENNGFHSDMKKKKTFETEGSPKFRGLLNFLGLTFKKNKFLGNVVSRRCATELEKKKVVAWRHQRDRLACPFSDRPSVCARRCAS